MVRFDQTIMIVDECEKSMLGDSDGWMDLVSRGVCPSIRRLGWLHSSATKCQFPTLDDISTTISSLDNSRTAYGNKIQIINLLLQKNY